MSKIQRARFRKQHNMPSWKVMGRVSEKTGQALKNLVLGNDTSNMSFIVNSITNLLSVPIYDISADSYSGEIQTAWKRSKNYTTAEGIFFLSADGEATIDFISDESVVIRPHQVVFVDDRQQYRLTSNTKTRLILLSGKFLWDSTTHANGNQ